MLRQACAWAEFPIEVVDIQLRHDESEQISLSWHLTALERKRVLRSIGSPENKAAFERFRTLISGSGTTSSLAADGGGQGPEAGPAQPR